MKNASLIFSTSLYTVRLMVNSDFEIPVLDFLYKITNVGYPLLCCKASCLALKLVNSYGLNIIKWCEIKKLCLTFESLYFYFLPGLILWWETERGLTTSLIPISHKEIKYLRTHLFCFISIWNNTSRSTLFCLTHTQAPDVI